MKYAVRNVLYHTDVAQGDGIAQADFLDSFPLANWAKLDNIFERHKIHRYIENVSFLYILVEGNISNLIRVHPLN
jgi:hypothetical protein